MAHSVSSAASDLMSFNFDRMRLEVYLENPSAETLSKARNAGVKQVELADVGALSPTVAAIAEARNLMPQTFLNVMVNPKSDSFCYSPREIEEIETYIKAAQAAGADGFVFGAMREDGVTPDYQVVERVVKAADRNTPFTFHSVFDNVPEAGRRDVIRTLKSAGISTLMVSGGPNGRFDTHAAAISKIDQESMACGMAVMARGGIEVRHFEHPDSLQAILDLGSSLIPGGVHARFNAVGTKDFSPEAYRQAVTIVFINRKPVDDRLGCSRALNKPNRDLGRSPK